MNKRAISVLKAIAVWTPIALLGPLFVLQGLFKFQANSPWPQMFANWGYPPGFHLVIGGVELLAGALLLVPRLSGYAALTLATVMAGACLTHVVHGETLQGGFTFALTVIFSVLTYVRLPRGAFPFRRSVESPLSGARH